MCLEELDKNPDASIYDLKPSEIKLTKKKTKRNMEALHKFEDKQLAYEASEEGWWDEEVN